MICSITNEACLGRVISDDDDESSQFFSRAKAKIDEQKILRCPSFGISKEEVIVAIKRRVNMDLEEKLKKVIT